MAYDLGIDVGTTFTAAAISRDGVVEVVALGTTQVSVPSLIFAGDNELLFAGAADRRGVAQPQGLAREFKRRVGDPVPLMLSGSPYHADRLTALMARWAADAVAEQIGSPADRIVITHPANWTEYQLGTLRNALGDVELGGAELVSEPTAAATDYAAVAALSPDSMVLVYDLGGGTFDVALLRGGGGKFEQVVEPSGIERLGGIDFDEAVFQFTIATLPEAVLQAARQHPDAAAAITQLRRRCVDAKEALSSDAASDIPVMLPNYTSTVRITRAEFESMIQPSIMQTIELVQRTLERAQLDPGAIDAALLVGGSSRIPLVSQLVAAHLDVPVRIDAHPKLVTAGCRPPRRSQLDGAGAPATTRRTGRRGWPTTHPARRGRRRRGSHDRGRAVRDARRRRRARRRRAGHRPGVRRRHDAGERGIDAGDRRPGDRGDVGDIGNGRPDGPGGGRDQAPGDVVWTAPTDGPLASVKGPAVAADSIVFGSQDGNVYKVAAADGSVEWKQPIASLVFSSPLVVGDTVVSGSSDGVFNLALADGAVRWQVLAGTEIRSSPAVDGDVVYIGSDDGNLYALDLTTGAIRWASPLGGKVSSSPAVADGVVYVGSEDAGVYALDAATGNPLWRTATGGPITYSSPAIEGDMLYVGSTDQHLYAIDRASGDVKWRFATDDLVSGSPAVADGVVYIGSFDGGVYTVDARIGGERWRFDTGANVFSSPKVAGDTVYVGSHARALYALSVDDGAVRWEYQASAIVGGTPTVTEDRVFVMGDDGALTALQR